MIHYPKFVNYELKRKLSSVFFFFFFFLTIFTKIMYEIDLMIKKALKFRQKNNKKDKNHVKKKNNNF